MNRKRRKHHELKSEQHAGNQSRRNGTGGRRRRCQMNKIGKRYGVTVDDLVRWNKISNPRLILVGQKLKIYIR